MEHTKFVIEVEQTETPILDHMIENQRN